MKKGDRVRLPATLSQPAGEYRIVRIDADLIHLVSTKGGVKRQVPGDQLPQLMERATPAPSAAFHTGAFNRDEGVLSLSGYGVGATAEMPALNRQIALRRVFEQPAAQLRVANDEVYRAEWGEARTEKRLVKMMRCLESFISLHMSRGLEYRRAIAEWKEDLEWLDAKLRAPNGFRYRSMWLPEGV